MDRFTRPELADMHFVYGLADGNAREARRLYTQRFPNRVQPDHRIFQRLHANLREDGTLVVS